MTSEQADKAIKSTLGTLAISNMYPTEEEIRLVKAQLIGETSEEEFKAIILKKITGEKNENH